MSTRVPLLVGFLCLIGGVALGGAAAYTWMRPGEPASTSIPPQAVDGSAASTTKTPVFELKTKPSPVAKEFDFRALLDKVAGPVLRPGNTISLDGGGSRLPGQTHLRHMGLWACKGNGHEGAVFESLIKEVEAIILTKGGVISIRHQGESFGLAQFWERQYSMKSGEDRYSGILRVWCVAGEEAPKSGQRFTVIVTLDELGP